MPYVAQDIGGFGRLLDAKFKREQLNEQKKNNALDRRLKNQQYRMNQNALQRQEKQADALSTYLTEQGASSAIIDLAETSPDIAMDMFKSEVKKKNQKETFRLEQEAREKIGDGLVKFGAPEWIKPIAMVNPEMAKELAKLDKEDADEAKEELIFGKKFLSKTIESLEKNGMGIDEAWPQVVNVANQMGIDDVPQEYNPNFVRGVMVIGEVLEQGKEEDSAKEKEIQRYLDLGIADTETEAIKLTEGHYKVDKDDEGYLVLMDATPHGGIIKRLEDTEKNRQIVGEPTIQKPKKTSKENPFQVSKKELRRAIGPGSSIKQFVNNIFGWGVPGQIFGETEDARNKIRFINRTIKERLRLSSRGNKYDIEELTKAIPNPDTMFADPDSGIKKYRNAYNMIKEELETKKEIIGSGDLPADQKNKYKKDINNLKVAMSFFPDEKILLGERILDNKTLKKMSEQEVINFVEKNRDNLTKKDEDAIMKYMSERE